MPAQLIQPGNVVSLLNILNDESLSWAVREHAAGALGEIGDRRAVEHLVDALEHARLRRGAAVALGRMHAAEAADALRKHASVCRAAGWALFECEAEQTLDETIGALEAGHLRHIGRQIERLSDTRAEDVSCEIVQRFRAVAHETPRDEHCWLVTSLEALATRVSAPVQTQAAILVVDALGRSVGSDVGIRHRLIKAVAALGASEACAARTSLEALVEFLCRVDYPTHKHAAAVVIDRVAKSGGPAALNALVAFEGRLHAELDRFEAEAVSAEPVTPPRAWDAPPGSPRWAAAARRAIRAMERLLARCRRA